MYLVKVSDFVQMTGPPEPHHILREKGLLHEWQPGMFVIFISHQWLGVSMPDPTGAQLAVLREVLRGLIDGSLKVEADLTSMDMGKGLKPAVLQRVSKGYLFLDWFAIPQITARTHGINEATELEEIRTDASKAVQSIPAYVEACDLFIALVPDLVHADTGKRCNYLTWLSRGWCRAELWCRLLSNREDTSVVVVFSAKDAEFMFPLDWQENRISDGLFTVESDRASVVKLGEMALTSKLEHLKAHGPLSHYRFYLARRAQLLNQEKKALDLPGFLKFFDFPDLAAAVREVDDQSKEHGMTGMLCGVLAGDVDILRQLVEHRGDANGRALGLADLGYYDSQTLLMVAAKSFQDPVVLSTLISLNADPNMVSRAGIGPVFLARRPEHVHVLLGARADMNTSGTSFFGVAGRGSTETVQAFLEARCDPHAADSERMAQGFTALHAVPMFGRSNPSSARTVHLLMTHRCDVNAQIAYDSMHGWESIQAQLRVAIWGLDGAGAFWRKLASFPGATPLAIAALMGDKGLVQLLLELDADVELCTQRGDSPAVLARASGHCDVAEMLSTFHV